MIASLAGKRILLTGHTGFKGSWLLVWLEMLGAKVAGLSLAPPTRPALFDLIGGAALCARHQITDVRETASVAALVADFAPDHVIHMAAQALVLPSLQAPVETFATNVVGTAAILDACRLTPPGAILVITSDKVYANDGSPHAFVEDDRLGGHDPYSASKAASELVVDSYRASYFKDRVPVATARAGNVIGGGDWAQHRIIPDAVRALDQGKPLVLRRPDAVRPWQHVLDPLAGYLELVTRKADGAFNFGPDAAHRRTVSDLIAAFSKEFDGQPGWTLENATPPPEAPYLTLSAARAQRDLGWSPKLDFETAIAWTAHWYRQWREGADMLTVTRRQIEAFYRL